MPDSGEGTIKLGLTPETVLDDLASLLGDEDKGTPQAARDPQGRFSKTEADAEPGTQTETPDETEQSGEDGKSAEGDQPATDEDSEPPKKYRIKGTDEEVTEDELVNGYLRQKDYTQKTQALAESRKKFETEEMVNVRKEREHYAQYLTELKNAVEQQQPKEPDWNVMRNTLTPDAFTMQLLQWNEHQKSLNILKARETEAKAKVDADRRQQMDHFLAAENDKLLSAVPEWKDPAKRKASMTELKTFAREALGYSDQEIDSIYDHRAILALRKAFQAEKAEKKKPEIRRSLEAVKVATPGPSNANRRQTTEYDKLSQRLAKTGSKKDAAAMIEQLLG